MKPILLITVLLLCASCHVGRYFYWNFADINDHKKFPKRDIENDPNHIFRFHAVDSNVTLPLLSPTLSMDEILEQSKTVAFLVIQNDTLLYEKYLYKRDTESIVPSFSVAKSFVSTLIGIAIDEGKIQSVQNTVRQYIPELPAEPFGKITIEHLLNMESGLRFNEGYTNPFGHVAKFYYGLNLKKFIHPLKAAKSPGSGFQYLSVDTQLLAWILENATGKKVSDYLEEKIWQPLGMEYPSSWSVDSKKHQTEKAFCCLNARARDFAKLGRLFLNDGDWNGQQVVSKKWVKEATNFNGAGYHYQWWREPSKEYDDFYAQGILGQYVYVNRDTKTIIVRLGKKNGSVYWERAFRMIASKL